MGQGLLIQGRFLMSEARACHVAKPIRRASSPFPPWTNVHFLKISGHICAYVKKGQTQFINVDFVRMAAVCPILTSSQCLASHVPHWRASPVETGSALSIKARLEFIAVAKTTTCEVVPVAYAVAKPHCLAPGRLQLIESRVWRLNSSPLPPVAAIRLV